MNPRRRLRRIISFDWADFPEAFCFRRTFLLRRETRNARQWPKSAMRLHVGDNHTPGLDLCRFFREPTLTSVRGVGGRFVEFETIYQVLAFGRYFFSDCVRIYI